MIKHVVFWKLKEFAEGRSKHENLIEFKSRLEGLQEEIPQILHLQVGLRAQILENEDFDVCLIIDLESKEDLKIYQDHPAHIKFKEFASKLRETRKVIDFEV